METKVGLFSCEGGHVMGVVTRNSSRVRRLLLYRQAIPQAEVREGETLEEVDVAAVIEGYAANIRCSVCGRMRVWVPGQEALEAMLRRMRRQG
jgi:hypothetical protein